MEKKAGGIADELGAFFTAQLDLDHEEKGNICFGEGDCEDTATVEQLFDLLPTKPLVEVCERCNAPRGVIAPSHLAPLINSAFDTAAMGEAGATFAYPEALGVSEWLAFRCLLSARAKARKKEEQKPGQETKEETVSRLQAMRRRGR